jgi:hypothetical protein
MKRRKERFLSEVNEIKKSLIERRKGRKPSLEGLRNRLSDSIPKKWRSVFKFHVGSNLEKHFDVRVMDS